VVVSTIAVVLSHFVTMYSCHFFLKWFNFWLQIKQVDPTLDMEADAGDDYIHLPVCFFQPLFSLLYLRQMQFLNFLILRNICVLCLILCWNYCSINYVFGCIGPWDSPWWQQRDSWQWQWVCEENTVSGAESPCSCCSWRDNFR
jgi:hypothetical protein